MSPKWTIFLFLYKRIDFLCEIDPLSFHDFHSEYNLVEIVGKSSLLIKTEKESEFEQSFKKKLHF
jgi:hypothetical protein